MLGDELAVAATRVLLLPNIELRSRVIVRSSDGRDSRVNFHVLFSDDVTAADIEEHFLRQFRFTAESAPGAADQEFALTVANLEELGRRLKANHEPFRTLSDLFVGMDSELGTQPTAKQITATDSPTATNDSRLRHRPHA